MQHELLPAQDEDDEEINEAVLASLPLDVVEKAIKSVATRVNYGLDASAIPNAPVSAKLPAGWQIWRWEVKEEFRDWLPKNAKDKAAARIAERQQVSRSNYFTLRRDKRIPATRSERTFSPSSRVSRSQTRPPSSVAVAKRAIGLPNPPPNQP